MSSIYQKLAIKNSHRHTALSQAEAEFLYDFVKNNKLKRTLEIGFAFGCSAAHIMSATKKIHYIIDPYQNSDRYENLGIKNIQKIKLDKNLKFFPQYSHQVLPELLKKKLKFDLIFHDGSHKFDDIFVDFYYSDLLIGLNGYIIMHDAATPAVETLANWIKTNKINYQPIKSLHPDLLVLQKTHKDSRKWHDFRTFTSASKKRISY